MNNRNIKREKKTQDEVNCLAHKSDDLHKNVFRMTGVAKKSTSGLHYSTGGDLAQSTSPQMLTNNIGSSSDESCVGELHLFNPSSTTYVKHFYSRFQTAHSLDFSVDTYTAGFWNTTSAIDGIRYTMTSGNFDGVIKQYGLVEL